LPETREFVELAAILRWGQLTRMAAASKLNHNGRRTADSEINALPTPLAWPQGKLELPFNSPTSARRKQRVHDSVKEQFALVANLIEMTDLNELLA